MVVITARVGDAALLSRKAKLIPSIRILVGLGLVGIAPITEERIGIDDLHVSMHLE